MTWIFIPSNCLPESASLEKDCEPGSLTWAERLAPSLTLNGKLTRPASWRLACKKAAWMQHLCGATSPPSTLTSGLEPWIASLRASRAKTCHLQADALGSMASAAGCFLKSPALPVIAVRDTSFWRTSQASLLPPPPLWTKPKALSTSAQPPASWENWPTSGGMRNGRLFQRPTLEPATGGRGGFAGHGAAWQTPQVGTGENSHGQISGDFRNRMEELLKLPHWTTPSATDGERGGCLTDAMTGTSLTQQVRSVWATPTSNEHTGAGHPDSKQGTMNLRSQAGTWATPDCNTSTYSNGKMGPNIREQAATWNANSAPTNTPNTLADTAAQTAKGADLTTWPTPASRDYRTPNSKTLMERGGGTKGEQLPNYVEHHFSPQAQPTQPGPESSPDSHGLPQHSASKNSTTHRPLSRRLNPMFVENLMGWPLDWTSTHEHSASSAAATASFRLKLATLLASSLPELKGLFDEKM